MRICFYGVANNAILCGERDQAKKERSQLK